MDKGFCGGYSAPQRRRPGSGRGRNWHAESLEPRLLLALTAGPDFIVAPDGIPLDVAMDDRGDFILAVARYPASGVPTVYAERFKSTGEPDGAALAVKPGGDASVAMDPAGDFVFVWWEWPANEIHARRYDAAGTALGGDIRVSSQPGSFPQVAMLADGRSFVAWGKPGTGAVMGRFLDAAGVPQGAEIAVSPPGPVYHRVVGVVHDAVGNVVVAWIDLANDQLLAQRIDPAGNLQGPSFLVGTTGLGTGASGGEAAIAMNAAGDLVFAWRQGSSVLAARYNAGGLVQGPMTVESSGGGYSPTVTIDGAGNFVLTYVLSSPPYVSGLYGRFFTSAGVPDGARVLLDRSPSGRTHVAMRPAGDFIYVYYAVTSVQTLARRYGGSISGVVFEDRNGSGTRSPGEPLMGGWTVYADLNDNGQLDAGEPTTVSHSTFGYSFHGLPLGTPITVRAVPRLTQGAPWEVSATPGPVTLTARQPTAAGRDIGQFRRGFIFGAKYEDDDADGTRDPGEPGLPGWTVYLDENQNGRYDAAGTTPVASADVPQFIGSGARVPSLATSSLSAAGLGGTISHLYVTLDVSFPDVSDLTLVLRGPSGRAVDLVWEKDGFGANFSGTTFDDRAVGTLAAGSAPYSGRFRPRSPLSAFDGENPNGTWTLAAGNLSAGTGSIDAWSLSLTTTGEAHAVTNSFGDYKLDHLRPGVYPVREVQQTGWFVSTPPGGGAAAGVFTGAGTEVNFGNWRMGATVGSVFDDADADGVRDPGESGIPGWGVYDDVNRNGVYDGGAPVATPSADVPQRVPPGSAAVSQLTTAGLSGTVTGVTVTLDLSAPSTGSLTAVLAAPDGTEVALFRSQPARGFDLPGVTFDDQAAGPPPRVGPYSGSYQPADRLSSFRGIDPNGTWTLTISSTATRFDFGTLNAWSIAIATTPEPSAVTDPRGDYALTLAPGGHALRQEVRRGWRETAPPYGQHDVVITSGLRLAGRDFSDTAQLVIGPTPFAMSIGDGRVDEADDGTTGVTFDVRLTAPADFPLTVGYTTVDGTASSFAAGTEAVRDGSFEAPDVRPGRYDAGQSLGAWTVESGSVSAAGGWRAAQGSQALDMTPRDAPGAVYQDVRTTAGQPYVLRFALAGNPAVAGVKRLLVSFDGVPIATESFDTTGRTADDMGWVYKTYRVVPTSDVSRLGFAAVSGGAAGPVLDDVTLTGVGDYGRVAGTLTFAPGVTSQTITVPVYGDGMFERDESFYVNLFNPQGGPVPIVRGSGTGIILNDDRPPTITVGDAASSEGDSGETAVTFPVTLSAPAGVAVSFGVSGKGDSAAAGVDFAAPGGSLTFVPGATRVTVTANVHGDTAPEDDETFFVNLDWAVNGTVVDGEAVGTIRDDDGPGPGPRVTGVFVAGSAWSAAFLDFLQSRGRGDSAAGYAVRPGDDPTRRRAILPWGNLDRVSIRFDQDVVVHDEDLHVRGVQVALYKHRAFSYDTETHTATWTLERPVRGDRLLLVLDAGEAGGGGVSGRRSAVPLDGEWASGSGEFPSGNGAPGGDFEFPLDVLAGDVQGDGVVAVLTDILPIRQRWLRSVRSPGSGKYAYDPLYDVNGDGQISDADVMMARANAWHFLPTTDPLSLRAAAGGPAPTPAPALGAATAVRSAHGRPNWRVGGSGIAREWLG